jgi:hypothetical protein
MFGKKGGLRVFTCWGIASISIYLFFGVSCVFGGYSTAVSKIKNAAAC